MFQYSARPDLLKDRVILVTGAGRGIGAAAAKAYAAHGATVLLLGKTEANLNEVHDQITAAGHPAPVVVPFNLETALPHQYDELAVMVENEFGRLDGLLHNASIIGPRTPLEQLSGENFMRVMHINVNAMFMLTQTLLPLLKLSEDASVVFTSSSVGRKGRAYWGAYGVSKFATEGLMQTLADELAIMHRGRIVRRGTVEEVVVTARRREERLQDIPASVSAITGDDVARMAPDAIVFAMANPTPEIDPAEAAKYAKVVASGRSDYPNQINNVLAFPGVFRGLLDARSHRITDAMLLAAARAWIADDPDPQTATTLEHILAEAEAGDAAGHPGEH